VLQNFGVDHILATRRSLPAHHHLRSTSFFRYVSSSSIEKDDKPPAAVSEMSQNVDEVQVTGRYTECPLELVKTFAGNTLLAIVNEEMEKCLIAQINQEYKLDLISGANFFRVGTSPSNGKFSLMSHPILPDPNLLMLDLSDDEQPLLSFSNLSITYGPRKPEPEDPSSSNRRSHKTVPSVLASKDLALADLREMIAKRLKTTPKMEAMLKECRLACQKERAEDKLAYEKQRAEDKLAHETKICEDRLAYEKECAEDRLAHETKLAEERNAREKDFARLRAFQRDVEESSQSALTVCKCHNTPLCH
jgi:hypothetical protein